MQKKSSLSIIFLLCLLIGIDRVNGQNYVLSGQVIDSLHQSSLYGANIYLPDRETGTATDEQGRFRLNLSGGKYQLRISHTGYDPRYVTVELQKDTQIRILLRSTRLQEVHIVAEKQIPLFRKNQNGNVSLPIERATFLPSFSGYPDLIKAAAFIPGVSASRDGFSQLVVRGTEYDQNMLLVDGVPLLQYNHLFGLQSAVNTDVVQDFTLLKSSKPAEYDNFLGSALDVKIDDGSAKERSTFTFGLLNSGYQRSDKLGQGGYNAGIRLNYFDAVNILEWLKTLRSDSGVNYDFIESGDLTLKVHQPIGSGDLYITGLGGISNVGYFEKKPATGRGTPEVENSSTQQNRTGMVTLKTIHYPAIEVKWENQIYYSYNQPLSRFSESSTYKENSSVGSLFYLTKEMERKDQRIKIGGLRSKADILMASGHSLDAGLEFQRTDIRSSIFTSTQIGDTSGINQINRIIESGKQHASYYAAFIQYLARIGDFEISGGLRSQRYPLQKEFKLLPRLSVNRQWNTERSLYFNYFASAQDRHIPYGNIRSREYPRWILKSPDDQISTSHTFSLGYSQESPGGIEWNAELFYMALRDLTYFRHDVESSDRMFVEWDGSGKGYSAGLELQVSKAWRNKANIQVGYTFLRTSRKYPLLNNGRPFPSDFGRRHELKIQSLFPFQKLLIGSNFIFGSGFPYTFPQSKVENTIFPSYNYISSMNNYELPLYHRLDLSISRAFESARGRRSIFSFNIFNVYFHKNADHIELDLSTDKIRKITNFGIIPSFYYKLFIN